MLLKCFVKYYYYFITITIIITGIVVIVVNRRGDKVPLLYFPVSEADYLGYDGLLTVYSVQEEALPDKKVSTRLQLIVGEYTVDGEFLGYQSADHGHIQLCPDTVKRLDAAYDIGVDYRQKVTIQQWRI